MGDKLMPNVKFQDATVIVHGSSRYNNNSFDVVHVHTTIVTDSPITDEYYVPNGVTLHPAALELVKSQGLEFRPYRVSDLLAGTENIRESAQEGDVVDTTIDSAKLLLLSTLKKTSLVQTAQIGTSYVYELKYDYKIYPLTHQSLSDSYEFQIRLPFDGTGMINGSRVQLTVVTPINVEIDQNATVGVAENGQLLDEKLNQLVDTNRMVVTFEYQVDPLFTVRYKHLQGLYQG
jgi:hypothetical protein